MTAPHQHTFTVSAENAARFKVGQEFTAKDTGVWVVTKIGDPYVSADQRTLVDVIAVEKQVTET
jgi:hypothetical protein